jgi:predicted alpha/beta superfamily hydrolase
LLLVARNNRYYDRVGGANQAVRIKDIKRMNNEILKKNAPLFLALAIQLLIPLQLYSQVLTERKIYSKNIKGEVTVRIWLPDGFSKTEKYPVIYEFVYDHTNFIAHTAANVYEMPKCVVVYTGIRTGNEHYSSPSLSENGKKYYAFLTDELIPLVEKEYGGSNYRIAAGMSQGADYVNYIFRNDPGLFAGYLLFATEAPNYKFDYAEYSKTLPRSIDYFVATGGDDEPERIEYAKSLVGQLDKNQKVRVKMFHYERAEHSRVILHALPDALEFLFQDFIIFRRPHNENSYQYFRNLLTELKLKYGREPPLGLFIANFLNVVKETRDVTRILDLVGEFEPRLSELDLFNFGYALAQFGEYGLAEKILKMSIQKTPAAGAKISPSMAYRTLALNIYDKQGKIELAFRTLQDGNEKIKANDVALLYYAGNYAINKKFKVQEGVDALITFQANRERSSRLFTTDAVDVLIAKGYLLLDKVKDAKAYLDKALKANPNNVEANGLLNELTN